MNIGGYFSLRLLLMSPACSQPYIFNIIEKMAGRWQLTPPAIIGNFTPQAAFVVTISYMHYRYVVMYIERGTGWTSKWYLLALDLQYSHLDTIKFCYQPILVFLMHKVVNSNTGSGLYVWLPGIPYNPWNILQYKHGPAMYVIHIIRRSQDRRIFPMRIPTLIRRHLSTETVPGWPCWGKLP